MSSVQPSGGGRRGRRVTARTTNRHTAPSPEMSPANVNGPEYSSATLLTTQL